MTPDKEPTADFLYFLMLAEGRSAWRLIPVNELQQDFVWSALRDVPALTSLFSLFCKDMLVFEQTHKNLAIYRFESPADSATLNDAISNNPSMIVDIVKIGELLYRTSEGAQSDNRSLL